MRDLLIWCAIAFVFGGHAYLCVRTGSDIRAHGDRLEIHDERIHQLEMKVRK